jgi:hypothetical protein
VTDHETLSLSINVASIFENGGALAATGTVTRSNIDDLSQPLVVNLASSNPGEATIPTQMTIPVGQASADFPIDAVDDLLLDGVHTVTISAAEDRYGSAESQLIVRDNETRFFVVDGAAKQTFRYDVNGAEIVASNLAEKNVTPRGVTSSADGSIVWIVDRRNVFVYDGSGNPLGKWKLLGVSEPGDIAVSGQNLFVVDYGLKKVLKFTGGADRRSGKIDADFSFALNKKNKNPQGVASDGKKFWVVNDKTTDKVFLYGKKGKLLGSWAIDPANSSPSGITIDPSGASNDVWIVDRNAAQVFAYANGRTQTTGGLAGQIVVGLAAENVQAEGVADPVPGLPDSIQTAQRTKEPARHRQDDRSRLGSSACPADLFFESAPAPQRPAGRKRDFDLTHFAPVDGATTSSLSAGVLRAKHASLTGEAWNNWDGDFTYALENQCEAKEDNEKAIRRWAFSVWDGWP